MKPEELCQDYLRRLTEALRAFDTGPVSELARALWDCWENGHRVFICGNGGSAANAEHLANDLLYGVDPDRGRGLRVTALPANASVLTCLANDRGYEQIFSRQLSAQGEPGDILIALSGSGNSPNIIRALEAAADAGIKTFAVLGYSGGKARDLADCVIHFPVDDMQVSEDLQMVVGHMVMKWLKGRRQDASSPE